MSDVLQPKKIHVSALKADCAGDHYLVTIDKHEIHLQRRLFGVFALLAFYRKNFPPGPVHRLILDTDGENAPVYIYRLKTEIWRQMGLGMPLQLFWNDRAGHYWLAAPPRSITIDLDNLSQFPDYAIAHLGDMLNTKPSKASIRT